jgi:hypothetical protein
MTFRPAQESPKSLETDSLSLEHALARFPNAGRRMRGGLFISHSGIDDRWIRGTLFGPVISRRFPPDGAFLHNRLSGGADGYRQLVVAALHLCTKFMVVVSTASYQNTWVRSEVSWALDRRRPILACQVDGVDPVTLDSRLGPDPARETYLIDFRENIAEASARLANILDDLLGKYPFQTTASIAREPEKG